MRKIFSVIAAILASAILLSGCGLWNSGGDTPPPTPTESFEPQPSDAVPTIAINETGDGRFSLRYNSERALNPITGTNPDNMLISPLLYESLFILNSDFSVEKVLCESYKTEDGRIFTFKLIEDVAMSDGTTLDARDAAFSINEARHSDKYAERLSNITDASATATGELRVTLARADYGLPAILDIPIIKNGYSGNNPPGSGPYRYTAADGPARLVRSASYRDADKITLDTIYLVECDDKEIGEYFTNLTIDLFAEDPNGIHTIPLQRDHETRYYDTTVLQYVGFNPRVIVTEDVNFRRAVALAVDRAYIADTILGGRAKPAYAAISPAYSLYEQSWGSASTGDARVEISAILEQIGMFDSTDDDDTWLEYPTADGLVPFQLNMLVSEENPSRVAAAQSIADTLRRVGVHVELIEKPFDEFQAALKSGAFDMYYGETRIPANFDFSCLLAPNGTLNYGHMGGEEYTQRLSLFFGANGEFARKNAARELCAAITDGVPFVPVVYKQYAVRSGRNAIRDMTISPSGVFCRIADWKLFVTIDS
jgi:ABC-type transport system substrate-binding protein